MITRETVKEFFNRVSSGFKRLGSEPVTKAPEFAISPDGTRAFALIRNGDGGFELKEKLQRQRKMRNHTFHDVGSFAAWLKGKRADPAQTEILVATSDRGKTLFTAALDPGEYGGDVVTCELQHHPRYARWAELFDRPVSQAVLLKHLYSVCEDAARVEDSDGNDLGSQAEQMAGELASFTVSKDMQATQEFDRHGRIVLQGGSAKTTTSSTLPTVFTITVPVFRGIEVVEKPDAEAILSAVRGDDPPRGPSLTAALYTIQVRLYISTKDGVTFTLEAPDLPIVLDAAVDDAVAHLNRDLGADWLVGRGQMQLTDTFDRDAVAPGGKTVGAED